MQISRYLILIWFCKSDHHDWKISQVTLSGIAFVDFVFHSCSCYEGFLLVSQVSRPTQKPTLLNSDSMSRADSEWIFPLQSLSLSLVWERLLPTRFIPYTNLPTPILYHTLSPTPPSLTCPSLRKCSRRLWNNLFIPFMYNAGLNEESTYKYFNM